MRRHFLSVLQRAAIGKVRGDAGRAECMIADRRVDAGRNSASADHAPGVRLLHGLLGQNGGVVSARRAEQAAFSILGDAGRGDVGVQRLGKRMMARHGVMLAAFLMQPDPPARPCGRRSSTFIFSAAECARRNR